MNKMPKKKVLICGATGFIGRNMAEYFVKRDDFEVYGTYFDSQPLNNSKIKMIKADLRNRNEVYDVLKEKDIVIQTSAVTTGSKDVILRPYIHITDNVIMNSLIFEAAYCNKVKHVLFPSCTVVYQSSDKPLREKDCHPEKGVAPKYFGGGWMKVFSEKLCEFYAGLGGTKFTAFRHSNIYGPYDKFELEKSHVFAATITKVMMAEEGEKIIVWGTGEEERDLLYALDLTSFIEKAIDKQKTPFELVNIGSGRSISISNLVKKIIEASGKNLKIEYDATKPTIKTKVVLDYSKAKEIFGWEPKYTLEEGIKKTMEWYKSNFKIC